MLREPRLGMFVPSNEIRGTDCSMPRYRTQHLDSLKSGARPRKGAGFALSKDMNA